jgi:hypothetical protein
VAQYTNDAGLENYSAVKPTGKTSPSSASYHPTSISSYEYMAADQDYEYTDSAANNNGNGRKQMNPPSSATQSKKPDADLYDSLRRGDPKAKQLMAPTLVKNLNKKVGWRKG